MVDKVHGLIPEAGSWTEGKLLFVYKPAASLLDADVKELSTEGTIVILENDGVNTYAALGYAGELTAALTGAGWVEGTFAVA